MEKFRLTLSDYPGELVQAIRQCYHKDVLHFRMADCFRTTALYNGQTPYIPIQSLFSPTSHFLRDLRSLNSRFMHPCISTPELVYGNDAQFAVLFKVLRRFANHPDFRMHTIISSLRTAE